jgi:hypothetical protein
MYSDGPLLRLDPIDLGKAADRLLAHLSPHRRSGELLLAGRQALARLHPLDESCLRIANGTADANVGRAIAAHARLGEPGEADLEQRGCFLGGEQHNDGRDRLLRRRVAGHRRLRFHLITSSWR